MENELKLCPFCGKEITIKVYDEEGNCHGDIGCDYEKEPWSGLTYGLVHDNADCIISVDHSCVGCMGNWLFDTKEEAIEAWNRRAE